MSLRTIRAIAVGVAITVASVTAAAVPVSAAPAPADTAAAPAGSAPGVGRARAAVAANCQSGERVSNLEMFNIQWGGRRLCEYWAVGHDYIDGALQVYVVGTDHGVWTRWRNRAGVMSAWQPLKNGKVKPGDGRSIDLTLNQATGAPTIWVIGADPPPITRWWCITRNPSTGWGNWRVCTR
jgi:hypothetical protein